MNQPDVFLNLTATAWTAIGSIATAISIIVLALFNILTLRPARKQAAAAQTSLSLLQRQMLLSERPFVAIHSKYDGTIGAALVYAQNQGVGPALDVEARLVFDATRGGGEQPQYAVGCIAAGEKFQFLIGTSSDLLLFATLRYKSISGQRWRTEVGLIGGHPVVTQVTEDKE